MSNLPRHNTEETRSISSMVVSLEEGPARVPLEQAELQARLDVHDWFPLSDEELQRELLEIFSAFLEPAEDGIHLLLSK